MTCDTKEVQKLLSCLNANKSCAVDKIPARLLKETADTSAVPLSMLFNLSFKQGRLPKLWKSANITPIHKDGDRDPVENYRGISLEAVQRRATRWITRSDDDHDTRLSKLKLLSLSNRRFTRDVTFFLM